MADGTLTKSLGMGRSFTRVASLVSPVLAPMSPVSMADSAPPARQELTSEIGATGTTFFRGLLKNEEFNSALTGSRAVDVYEEMRRSDSQIRGILKVLKLPLLSADWSIGCDDEAAGEFLEKALFRRIDWSDFLKHALLCFDFGYEVLEKVYELDQGRIWLSKLAHRGQKTIYEWKVDDAGNLASVVQRVWKDGKYTSPEIPADRLVLFALDMEGNNFEGVSILRSAYKHWFIKDQVYKVDAIAHERHGIGVPVITLREGFTPADKTAAETITEEYRSGEKAGIVMTPGNTFEIKGGGEGTRYDPMPTIKHHDEMIARGPLAMFLNLGTTETGSRAVAGSMIDLFMDSEWAMAGQICAAVNEQIIRPLLELNFANAKNIKAELKVSGIGSMNVVEASKAAVSLALGGFLSPIPEDDAHFRTALDMAQRPEEATTRATDRSRGHRHQKLSDPATLVAGPEGFWRALTEPEKAMSLREIDGRQDDARDQVVNIVAKVRTRWAESLREQIREALSDGDPTDIEEIAIPDDLRMPLLKATVDMFRDLYRYGKRTVAEELNRQRKLKKLNERDLRDHRVLVPHGSAPQLREAPLEPKEVSDMFWVRGRMFISRLSSRVEARAKALSLSLYRTRHTDFTDVDLDRVAEEILSVAETASRLEATALVSEAFDMGRDAEAQDQKDEIETAIYSAILDENCCDQCYPLDGQEFDVGTPEYYDAAPPNKDCEGGDRCRCLYVYILK